MSELPPGLHCAPLGPGDRAAVTSLWRACEVHDDGEALFTEEDFIVTMQRPSLDVARHTIGVRAGEALVAQAVMLGERDVFACVAPAHRGLGIGRWLLDWTQAAGRAAGYAVTSQSVSVRNATAIALLEGDGYDARWSAWIFDVEHARAPDPPLLPPGYAIRAFVPGSDDRTVHQVTEGAFSEWPEYDPDTFEDWAAETVQRPGFAPDQIALAVRGEEVAGAMVLLDEERGMWVSQLAVVRAHRRRGLAHALLAHAFGVSWRAGHRHTGLATDSRTGARGLYEQVGMTVTRTFAAYAKPL